MTSEERQQLKDLLFSLIPSDGASIGNITLGKAFLRESAKLVKGLNDDVYWDIRNDLLEEGTILLGRGKGGSVYLADLEQPGYEEPMAVIPTYKLEADLYDPFYKNLADYWVKENNIRNFVIQKTAHQGSRATGGMWTRPDISLVHVGKYTFIPGKVLEVITFELKPIDDYSVIGVLEAAAHSAFAHRSYLAIHVTNTSMSSADCIRLKTECRRLGVGLVLFTDPAGWESYEVIIESERTEPAPQDVNSFITRQFPPDKQTQLLEMLK